MKIQIDADQLLKDLMECQPEFSSGMTLQCIDWDYKKTVFEFRDVAAKASDPVESVIQRHIVPNLELRMGDVKDAVVYSVGIRALRKGLKLMLEDAVKNKEGGARRQTLAGLSDAGQWDSVMVDSLVQYAIFGKEIYG